MVKFTIAQAFLLVTFGVFTPSLDLYTDLKMGLRLMRGPAKDTHLLSGKSDI